MYKFYLLYSQKSNIISIVDTSIPSGILITMNHNETNTSLVCMANYNRFLIVDKVLTCLYFHSPKLITVHKYGDFFIKLIY